MEFETNARTSRPRGLKCNWTRLGVQWLDVEMDEKPGYPALTHVVSQRGNLTSRSIYYGAMLYTGLYADARICSATSLGRGTLASPLSKIYSATFAATCSEASRIRLCGG